MSNIILPVQRIDISGFNYDLPDDLIARHPLPRRDECRLLVAAPARKMADSDALRRVLTEESILEHHRFDEIVNLLPENTLLVRNDTKVINARLRFQKETGAAIEIFLLDPLSPADYALNFQQTGECVWKCLVGNLKKWKEGTLSASVKLPDGREVSISAGRVEEMPDKSQAVRFSWSPEVPFGEIISAFGNIPIPPYLNRDSEESDLTDYQTVYARTQGSVAAPTAGLHFTDDLFRKIAESKRRVKVDDVTLHVGAGTFRPVKSETLAGHDMHSETFSISRELIDDLISAVGTSRLVAAVGTTTVRTLESLPFIGLQLLNRQLSDDPQAEEEPLHVSQWEPYETPDFDTKEALKAIRTEMNLRNVDSLTASTSILIGPGFQWRIVEAMITNFHQPESTLLLLVSSFLGMLPEEAGKPDALWRQVYNEAIHEGYRFLSYGDACLFFRHSPSGAIVLDMPGSKSISNRVVTLNAQTSAPAKLINLSDSDDTRFLASFTEILRARSASGEDPMPIDFFTGEGAATLRFAVALGAVTPGVDVWLIPSERLVSRLMATDTVLFRGTPLETPGQWVLTSAISVDRDSFKGCMLKGNGRYVFTYHVLGRRFVDPDETKSDLKGDDDKPIEIDCADFAHTSQEISALLLVSSRLPSMRISNLILLPSLPYVMMTNMCALAFGTHVIVSWKGGMPESFLTSPGELRPPTNYEIEGDWSALLNFHAFAAAARVADDRPMAISSPGCPPPLKSLQPDARQDYLIGRLLALAPLSPEEKKSKRPVENFAYAPDSAMPYVAAALSTGVPFRLIGLTGLLNKESDRIEAMKKEFGRLGWKLSKRRTSGGDQTLSYTGGERQPKEDNPLLDSHGDHRIAMALAATLPATRRFRLRNPGCVSKSMPRFWEQLSLLGVNYEYDADKDIAQLTYLPE